MATTLAAIPCLMSSVFLALLLYAPFTVKVSLTCCPTATALRLLVVGWWAAAWATYRLWEILAQATCRASTTTRSIGPGLIVHRLIQGGERWEALTLTAPGSVTLRQVGIRSKTFHPPATTNSGYFTCSDTNLNEIWRLGAYSGPLCQVVAGSLPTSWTVTPQGLDVTGGTYSSYQAGDTWTDFTATLEVQIVTNEASWLVRSSHSSGYRFVLGADNDTLGGFTPSNTTPNTLLAFQQNTSDQLGTVALTSLGIDIKPGTWHTVKAVVAGETVNTYLDGQLVLSFNVTKP